MPRVLESRLPVFDPDMQRSAVELDLPNETPARDPDRPPAFDSFEAQWRARFEELGDEHEDEASIAGWRPSGLDARVRQFLHYWAPAPGSTRWLDAGCGAGTYARLLRRHGLRVVGTDYSLPTLRKAMLREQCAALFAVADVRRLPFRDASFDGALCLGVMQVLSRSDEAVAELAAVVRPGGELWVDALNRWCLANLYAAWRGRSRKGRMPLRYESPAVLERLMHEQGIVDLRRYWLPLMPSRFKRLQRWVERPFARWVLRCVPLAGLLFAHSFIVTGRRPKAPVAL